MKGARRKEGERARQGDGTNLLGKVLSESLKVLEDLASLLLGVTLGRPERVELCLELVASSRLGSDGTVAIGSERNLVLDLVLAWRQDRERTNCQSQSLRSGRRLSAGRLQGVGHLDPFSPRGYSQPPSLRSVGSLGSQTQREKLTSWAWRASISARTASCSVWYCF